MRGNHLCPILSSAVDNSAGSMTGVGIRKRSEYFVTPAAEQFCIAVLISGTEER